MTYNKLHFVKVAKELAEKVYNLKSELEDLLLSDLENESSEIEPYENRNDLTEAQEQRQEWLDDAASNVEDAISSLEDAISSLEYIE